MRLIPSENQTTSKNAKSHQPSTVKANNNADDDAPNTNKGDSEAHRNTAQPKAEAMEGHGEASVLLLSIPKATNGSCGFHLTRSKWDPYPWVSAIDVGAQAEKSGLKAGDCVLEVNGEDVLGLRIADIAKLVRAKSGHVMLLLWRTGWDAKCDPESLCCGPMPLSLQRLSAIVQSVLSIIECPVCLDTIAPPAMQCQNGHLLCLNCRIRAEKCPVCRDRYTPRRALIAEQIYNAITSAYRLCRSDDKLRQRLFGAAAHQPAAPNEILPHVKQRRRLSQPHQTSECNAALNKPAVAVEPEHVKPIKSVNRLLAKLLPRKECAAEPLPGNDDVDGAGTYGSVLASDALGVGVGRTRAPVAQSLSHQFDDKTNPANHLTSNSADDVAATTSTLSLTTPTNNVAPAANGMSKHYSLSTNDLSQHQQRLFLASASPSSSAPSSSPLIAARRRPSWQRLAIADCTSMSMGDAIGVRPTSSPMSLDRQGGRERDRERRAPHCSSVNTSIECIQKRLPSPSPSPPTPPPPPPSRPPPTPPAVEDSRIVSPATSDSLDSMAMPLPLPYSTQQIIDELLSSNGKLVASAASSASRSPSTCKSPPTMAAAAFLTPPPTPSTPSSLTLSSSLASSVELNVAPVGVSSSPDNIALAASSVEQSRSTRHRQQLGPLQRPLERQPLNLLHRNSRRYRRFRCPCDCGKHFSASSQLLRHIRVEHRLPVLAMGGGSVRLALPLRPPVDNAVLLLEIPSREGVRHDAAHKAEMDEVDVKHDDDDDDKDEDDDVSDCDEREGVAAEDVASAKNDDRAFRGTNKGVKECWIRIKTLGPNCIVASALAAATDAESVAVTLEAHLTRSSVLAELVLHEATTSPAVRSSGVHSMETTTWPAIFNQQHNTIGGDCISANGNGCDSNSNSSNSSSSSVGSSSTSGCSCCSTSRGIDGNDLNIINVTYPPPAPAHGCDAVNRIDAVRSNDGDFLLNIDVRRCNMAASALRAKPNGFSGAVD